MKFIFILCYFLVWGVHLKAQNITLTPSVLSAPRLSYDDILALPSPQEGDLVFDITFKCLRVFTEDKWLCSFQDPISYTPNMMSIASAGGSGICFGRDITVDDSGNVYIAGYFQGRATFGSISVTISGLSGIFVAKYSSSGSLQWVQSAEVPGTNVAAGTGIDVDDNGNVYVTGYYHSTANFGSASVTSKGGFDIFVAKYNTNGILQWAQSAGGTSDDFGYGVAVDTNGNVYLTGLFNTNATFGTTIKVSQGGFDVFVAKYDTNGGLQWVQSAGSSMDDSGRDIIVNINGDVYVTGVFKGTATFNGTTKTSVGGNDVFVAKYDTNGIFKWVQSGGGPNADYSRSITLDAEGKVYITGVFQGSITFGSNTKTSQGGEDIFVAKLDPAVINWSWVQSAGGINNDTGEGITVDPHGNVFIVGSYNGTATFGNTAKTSSGLMDIFVAKYTTSGKFEWIKSAGGTADDSGGAIKLSGNGNVYVTGYYSSTATFGKNSMTAIGSGDLFLVRIDR